MMQELQNVACRVFEKSERPTELPFSIYTSESLQDIKNVPVLKPLLILVLSGIKELGTQREIVCSAGEFIFLSNSLDIDMKNIPAGQGYRAILIEFETSDFTQFTVQPERPVNGLHYSKGKLNQVLFQSIYQFVEIASSLPPEVQHFRRQELLQLMVLSGFDWVPQMAAQFILSHKVSEIIQRDIAAEINAEQMADELMMSESTLRRKLKEEGTSVSTLRSRIRLGKGLHLLQTTSIQIGRIAECCGYQSQSRFTDQFKRLFGMTPRELLKTRMPD
ncbi:helix-turn-helix transcriptional regulator [Veronia nyctiphanis]|nr:AraC family transcriptional regulator [Veronia nyctiphanis]